MQSYGFILKQPKFSQLFGRTSKSYVYYVELWTQEFTGATLWDIEIFMCTTRFICLLD